MGVEVLESGAGLRGRRGSSPETEEIVEAIRGYVKETMAKKETMLTRYFYAHGWFCASRPWEVIIGMITLTVCTMSMSIMASTRRVCGWNYKCFDTVDDTRSSDTIILSITRCLAVIYLYLQFRKMRKLGSKYLLGMAGVFTIASSIIFSVAVINIIGADLTGLHEALPFFLLLVDLSKACTLAKVAFSALNEDEVVEYIANGMSKLGPQLTLDAIVETLVIGVGTLSGIRTLETMCCFGCLSVIANYLAFMTFYPACLALILEVTRGNRALVQLKLLVKVWQEEEDSEKPNPVTQRVKVIMSTGLVFVHVHSRLFMAGEEAGSVGAGEGDSGVSGLGLSPPNLEISPPQIVMPEVSLYWFYLTKIATMSVDYVLTLLLAVLLSIKYVYFDEDTSRTRVARVDDNNDAAHESEAKDVTDFVPDNCQSSHVTNPHNLTGCHCESDRTITPPSTTSSRRDSPVQGSLFVVGDSSDEDDVETNKNKNKICIETQTEPWVGGTIQKIVLDDKPARELKECVEILKSDIGAAGLSNDEIIQLVHSKHIPPYKLESMIGDHERGVNIRRQLVASSIGNKSVLENLPFTNYDYKYILQVEFSFSFKISFKISPQVDGACCENVIGYMPVPVGVAGPLLLDGKKVSIPMATTEGCLVASTNRGCRALSTGVGVTTTVYRDGMTRGPVVRFSSAQRASEVHRWLEDKDNYDLVADAFDSTSRFARLQKLQIIQVSRSLYVRFLAITGDAMGMNMLSKGSEKALTMLQEKFFPDMEIMSLSGNICTDKKPSALNWIEGRGKSVVAEAIVSSDVIKNVLKTSVSALVDLNINKNLIGSAAAGSIGGFNAQAANIVTAIYIATGQDPAQNVCSSHCITLMEATGPQNEDLYISCTMPSIEVGTVGGGTVLPPQAACLEMLGVRGSHKEKPGTNAADLARIICGAVMAGELSLMSALAAGHLVRSHLKHNRSVQNMAPADAAASAVLPRRGSAAAAVSSTSTATGVVKSTASVAAASAATNSTTAAIAASSAVVNSTAANSAAVKASATANSAVNSAATAGVKTSATANSAVNSAVASNSAGLAGSAAGVQRGSHPIASSSDNSHTTTPHINHLAPVSSSFNNTASTDLKPEPALFHDNTQPSECTDKEPGTCLKLVL